MSEHLTGANPIDLVVLSLWGVLFFIVLFKFIQAVRMVPTKQAYVVERLGKYHKTLDAGFHALIPFFDQVVCEQDLKEETIDVPPQECFSKDEVKVEVDGVIYISVVDPVKATYGVTDYRYAAMQLAQTTTRSVIGTLELDRTFEERDLISSMVVDVLEQAGQGWGIKVHRYEIKNITPPQTVRDAMEMQVNAERERRAIMARSEGDKQSRINRSLGLKTEMINRSEGEMQRRINAAEGKAHEILTVAQATAESIEKMASVIAQPGGDNAMKMQLSEQYLKQLKGLAKADRKVILPANLMNYDSWIEQVGLTPTKKS